MKRTTIVTLILLAIVITTFVIVNLSNKDKKTVFVPKPGKVENIEFVLIKSAFGYDKTDILKPNAAVLVTNKEELIIVQQLFLAEKENDMMSMNGWDYTIQFWKNSEVLSHEVGVDQRYNLFSYKPEETNKQLRKYTYLLEKGPTHYLYDLSISTTIRPLEIKKMFSNKDLKLVFVDDTLFRYPNATLSFRHTLYIDKNAPKSESKNLVNRNSEIIDKTIESIITKIKRIATVVHQSEIFTNYSGGDDKTYSEVEDGINLHFGMNTDVKAVEKIIKSQKAKIDNFVTPKYYKIQLVDTRSNIEDIKKDMKKYDFIDEISEYSDPYRK